jgi:hypothetical protein
MPWKTTVLKIVLLATFFAVIHLLLRLPFRAPERRGKTRLLRPPRALVVLGLAVVVISPPVGVMLAWTVDKTPTAQHWLVAFIAALTVMGLYGLSLALRACLSWGSVSNHGVARSRLMRAPEHVSWSNIRITRVPTRVAHLARDRSSNPSPDAAYRRQRIRRRGKPTTSGGDVVIRSRKARGSTWLARGPTKSKIEPLRDGNDRG